MSNRRAVFSALIVIAAAGAGGARAQTQDLLDRVRGDDASATALARTELGACLQRGCPRAPELRLLLGFLLLSSGDAEEAARTLGAGRPPPGLEPFAAWYRGEAEAWSGRRAEGAATLRGAEVAAAPPWLRRRASLRRAELLLDAGRPALARPVLERAAAADPGPENLLARALARQGTGDRAQALRDFRTIALRFASHPHARLALARLEALGAPPAWTQAERQERAQGFLAAGEGAAALEELDALPGSTPREAWLRGQALLLLRQDEPAVEALEAAAAGADPAVAAEAAMALARRWMRLDRPREARAAFRRVDTGWPGAPVAEEAGYLAAWLSLNLGELPEAAAGLEAFERAHPTSRRRDEARWFRALALMRAGQAAEARAVLQRLWTDFPGSALEPQARYWEARLDTAHAGPAAARLQALIRAFPQSLYARLALEVLRRQGEAAPEPFPTLPPAKAVGPLPELALAARLAAAGLFPDAHQEAEAVAAQVRGPGGALRLGPALQALGEYAAAHALGGRHLWAAAYADRDPRALALLYPRAWEGSVDRWAKAQGVEPALAWAIMKRESGFRREVTSSAGARGPMQLLPATARQIAGEAGLPPPAPGALHGPDLSVRFGTWYLGRLQERLGHPGPVAAAYNGGPGPVLRWLDERGDEPLDRWIEGIPYKETRAYVKQVLADTSIYQVLYGGTAAPLPMALPRPAASGIGF